MRILRQIGFLFLDVTEVIVIAMAMFVVMYLFLFQPHQVRGNSMYANFHDGEYLLTDKISYRLDSPERGDVIVFKAPRNEEYDYIKRIIGLPRETIRVQNGKVFINNSPFHEQYLPEDSQTFGGNFLLEGLSYHISKDQYIVLGDNRSHSSDSRDWGPVPKENIVGKAWLRYWPVNSLGLIPKTEYPLVQ